ncbi:hypothetical protein OXB_1370 [Bacillus sp. OxB-1]|nr:hypothetical protein OXB_1370 [Bacillus sp. OxB-1]
MNAVLSPVQRMFKLLLNKDKVSGGCHGFLRVAFKGRQSKCATSCRNDCMTDILSASSSKKIRTHSRRGVID